MDVGFFDANNLNCVWCYQSIFVLIICKKITSTNPFDTLCMWLANKSCIIYQYKRRQLMTLSPLVFGYLLVLSNSRLKHLFICARFKNNDRRIYVFQSGLFDEVQLNCLCVAQLLANPLTRLSCKSV